MLEKRILNFMICSILKTFTLYTNKITTDFIVLLQEQYTFFLNIFYDTYYIFTILQLLYFLLILLNSIKFW